MLFNAAIENQEDSGGKSSDSSSSSSASEDESVRKKDTSTAGSYFGISAAKMMYIMADQLRKSSLESVWYAFLLYRSLHSRLAIVGMTDQYIHGRIDYKQYHNEVRFFKGEVQRFNADSMDVDDGKQDTKISSEKE